MCATKPKRTNPFFRWVLGRQQTGYSTMTLLWVTKWTPVPFDMNILKCPKGAHVPPHRDLVSGYRHYRFNIILTYPPGGKFVSETNIFRWGPFVFFRPDLSLHSVTPVEDGVRYVLSMGWALKNSKMVLQ
jgi:hypothetical protein